MGYKDVYAGWQADPERFWMEAAEAIDWTRKPTKAQGGEVPFFTWFEDGEANTCWNCIDRHVEAGRGEQADPSQWAAVRMQCRNRRGRGHRCSPFVVR